MSEMMDRELVTWLRDGPDQGPDDARQRAFAAVRAVRQRPAWLATIGGDVALAAPTTPPVPWRLVVVAALLIVAAAVGAVLIAGSRSGRLPAPFGPAANGSIAYAEGGDIYVLDPSSGISTPVLADATTIDDEPTWSRDGSRLFFARTSADGARLYSVHSDGGDLRLLTPEPLEGVMAINPSPDGRHVLFQPSDTTLALAATDGSGTRILDPGMFVHNIQYRPPEGDEILFFGRRTETGPGRLFAMDADLGDLRAFDPMSPLEEDVYAEWSPDGRWFAYTTFIGGQPGRLHIRSADGSILQTVPLSNIGWYGAMWSNDSNRVLVLGGGRPRLVFGVTVPVDGGDRVWLRALDGADYLAAAAWSPDDSAILAVAYGADGQAKPVFYEAATGEVRRLPWEPAAGSWQRLAP